MTATAPSWWITIGLLELYCKNGGFAGSRGCAHGVPSGMMDGQIAAMRALDEAGFEDVSILAYSAKYASASWPVP